MLSAAAPAISTASGDAAGRHRIGGEDFCSKGQANSEVSDLIYWRGAIVLPSGRAGPAQAIRYSEGMSCYLIWCGARAFISCTITNVGASR